MKQVRKTALCLASASLLLACAKKQSPEPTEVTPSPSSEEFAPRDAPLLPGDRPGGRAARCAATKDSAPFILRSVARSPGPGASALDDATVAFGSGVAIPGGFALGVLRPGSGSRAEVLLLQSGKSQLVDLGVVHGQAEPPVLLATGSDLLLSLADGDPEGISLRTARLVLASGTSSVTWGPVVQKGRTETALGSLAALGDGSALLAWDRTNGASAISEIVSLPLGTAPLKEAGTASRATSAKEDADSPLVLGSAAGFWLIYLGYEPLARRDVRPGAAEELGLVDEPARRLKARRLDRAGLPLGPALEISEGPRAALVFDAAVLPSANLLIAYREAPVGRPTDDQPLLVAEIGADGSVAHSVAQTSEELGPGAPVILAGATGGASLLAVSGAGSHVLLGLLGTGRPPELVSEASLFERVPLAVAGDRLFVAHPRSDGVELEVLTCAFSPPAP